MKNLAMLVMLSLLSGCALYRPYLRSETSSTNGVVTVLEIKTPVWALWPATTELSKQKATAGKTLALGTETLREDSGGTNVVEALKQLNDLLGKLK
jgi:hypothetical protein